MLTLLNDYPVKVLHIEPTDACNAACPQCAREVGLNFSKSDPAHHLTLEQVQTLFSVEFVKSLEKVFMCGNYGDPAAGKHTLEIFRWFKQVNPTITLGMNTNGSIKAVAWWTELAKLMTGMYDYVVFSIDGLSDTNSIYRVNTNWNKIMSNAQAFIAAGGHAHWDMLVYKHNEHQVDQAQEIAKSMGFTWFRAKVSKRFNEFPVSFLKPPVGWDLPTKPQGDINCHALKERSIYISAQGKIYPCCWLGHNTEDTIDRFEDIAQSWASNPNPVCVKTCSGANSSAFEDQWKREVALC